MAAVRALLGNRGVSVAAVRRARGSRPETKSLDIPETSINFTGTTSTQFTVLNAIQEGSGFWARIGRRVTMKSLRITGHIAPINVEEAIIQQHLRIIIVYDKQANGSACTIADVIKAYNNAGTSSVAILDGLNMDNRERFLILRDRRIVVPRVSSAGVATSIPFGVCDASVGASRGSDGGALVDEYISLNSMETQYNGTANPATIAEIVTGSLMIGVFGNPAVAATPKYKLTFAARLRFVDY